MANKLVQRNYKCKCGATLKKYVWDSDVHKHKFKCPECSGELSFSNIKIEKIGSVTAIRTPTKNR